ncbi:glycosyltransferase family 4 protein [Psychroflexus sp. CAK8W]|uniref:Glycosyltransferase family 4 protein n=1 Tax=Psychroflexus longus TaxID=2873596 RepID=A0ABS7XLU0_9FLAO|nr:glycosyltransferase family 4 protein [Psychroflexus longus]MBZ9779433.1 glycosyltransferase family 4 protein [Psychroflexus longus]
MNIVVALSKPPGYSETFFRSKIKGLQESGHQVILVTAATDAKFESCLHLQHPKVHKNSLVQLLQMLIILLSLLTYLKQVLRYVKLERIEGTGLKRIIEKLYINSTLLKIKTHWLHFGFATMAIERELVAKAIGAKLAVSLRGYDIGVYPLKQPNCYNRLWKYIDKVHVISDDLYKKALKHGLSSKTAYKKITPAINTEQFSSEAIDANNKSRDLYILTIGRLHWKKGFVDTLEALSLLKMKSIKFKYYIIGEGKDYERVAYAAHQLNLKDEVVFLGRLDHQEVKTELIKTDLYLQYSIQEGFCNSVLEAQALGKLCVVSDAEGLSENVLDQETGWVVPKSQPELLVDKIMEVILLDEEDKRKIQENAIKRVQNQFTLEQQKEKFNAFYEC